MKKFVLLALASTLAVSCSTKVDKNHVKSAYNKAIEEAKEEALDGDASFHGGKFSKLYSGDKKIKKVAIVAVTYATASTRGFEEQARSARMWESSDRFKDVKTGNRQDIPNMIYDIVREQFAATAGYEIMSPTELAEKSPTFQKLALQETPAEWGSYPTWYGHGAKGSRGIDKLTHAGALSSKIAAEAGVDALIQVNVSDMNIKASEGYYQSIDAVSFQRESTVNMLVCIPREKAKADGHSVSWLGDANICGGMQILNKHQVYYPEVRGGTKNTDADVVELSDLTAEYQKNYFQALLAGGVKAMKEEGL